MKSNTNPDLESSAGTEAGSIPLLPWIDVYKRQVLEEAGRLQWWQVFLAQFKDLLVIILIGAAAVSMLTGCLLYTS